MSDYQHILFSGSLVQIGTFAIRPEQPNFSDTGPTSGHLIVFPRLPVQITQVNRPPVSANPNLVIFYNQGQEYRRDALSPLGDQCQWFGFSAKTVLELLEGTTFPVERQPFRFTHGPASAESYARQRRLIQRLHQSPPPDPIFVEETALNLLSAAVRQAQVAWQGPVTAHQQPGKNTDRETASVVKQYLTLHYQDRLTLPALAAEVQYSPFHLSRIFRQQTGLTIHQYLSQLRLRAAFERLLSGEQDLTRLAVDLGFASHSHFTQAFHQTFGHLPSQVRKNLPLSPHES